MAVLAKSVVSPGCHVRPPQTAYLNTKLSGRFVWIGPVLFQPLFLLSSLLSRTVKILLELSDSSFILEKKSEGYTACINDVSPTVRDAKSVSNTFTNIKIGVRVPLTGKC